MTIELKALRLSLVWARPTASEVQKACCSIVLYHSATEEYNLSYMMFRQRDKLILQFSFYMQYCIFYIYAVASLAKVSRIRTILSILVVLENIL